MTWSLRLFLFSVGLLSLVGNDLHASSVATMMSFLGMRCGVFSTELVWSWLSLYLKRLTTHRFICVPLRSGSESLYSPTLRLSLQAYLIVYILLVYSHSHGLLLGARLIVVGRRLGIAPLNAASCLVDDLFPGLLAESIVSRRRFFLALSTKFLALSELIGHFKRRLGGMTHSPLHCKLNTKWFIWRASWRVVFSAFRTILMVSCP